MPTRLTDFERDFSERLVQTYAQVCESRDEAGTLEAVVALARTAGYVVDAGEGELSVWQNPAHRNERSDRENALADAAGIMLAHLIEPEVPGLPNHAGLPCFHEAIDTALRGVGLSVDESRGYALLPLESGPTARHYEAGIEEAPSP